MQDKDLNETSMFHNQGDVKNHSIDPESIDEAIKKIQGLTEDEIQEPEIEEQDETQSLDEDKKEDKSTVSNQELQKDDEQNDELSIELSNWEELSSDNSVVKKYIVYISKNFVPYIDSLSIDERTAYINDAIAKKIDLEDEKKQKNIKKNIKINIILAICTFIIMLPVALFIAHKAIMATFENYKYSQDNFEKLYKQRFAKDKSYMRSLQYNKEQEKRRKAQTKHKS